MRTLLPSAFVPLALLGSTVLGAGVAVGLTSKPTVPVRPAVFQENAANQAQAQPAPAPAAGEQPQVPAGAPTAPVELHHVQLASDGLFSGKISVVNVSTGAIEPVTEMVVWFMQNGEIKTSAKPGVAGVFQAANLEPGVYSIIASGPSGYLATGVNVLPFEAPKAVKVEVEAKPVSFAAQAGLGIELLAVPPTDTPKVLELANAYIPAAARTTVTAPLVDANAHLSGDELAKIDAILNGRATDTPPYVAVLMEGNRVAGLMTRMNPQTGKLLKFLPDRMKAFLVHGPTVVSEATIGTDGQFVFEGVSAGDFTVVVAGAEGFSAFGVQVVSPAGKVTQTNPQPMILQVSAKRLAGSGGLGGSTIDMSNFPAAYNQLRTSQPQQSDSTPQDGAPGGGGGSGGGGIGGGGAGGLGALGAALGAAGLAAALADNDDDSPTSP